MKFKKIGTKMLVCLLPVIILALGLLTYISSTTSKNLIEEEIQKYMSSELSYQNQTIENDLNQVTSAADTLARSISATYQTTTDLSYYEQLLTGIVGQNDIILGSGIWFEPYVYDPASEYVGPYAYKDGDSTVITYDYSNASYDYFNQEYYLLAKDSFNATITDPYYDETTGYIMSSCTAPIYSTDGIFLGCVTIDINLTSIQDIVNSIQIGDGGSAMLITDDGTYMAGVDSSLIEQSSKITDDENASLATAGDAILNNEDGSGITTYTNSNETYNLYYATLNDLGWKLIIQMPQSELNQPIYQLTSVLTILCIISVVICILVVIFIVRSISKNLKQVQTFAGSLAQGDFTTNTLNVKSKDELGHMGESLNEMYNSNKNIIQNISEHANDIASASTQLNGSAKELLTQFQNIENYMSEINEAMMTSSAATEQVNASAEEVNSNVTILANQTHDSMEMAHEIHKRAGDVGTTSKESYDSAISLSGQFEDRLQTAIENAKVVESIGEMANVISNIAEQINLLSLNASIEAARAGEQGKGFAVVASEIGKLANDTSDAVEHIQTTISDVQSAFTELTGDAKGMLDFVQGTVTPDYNNFVDVASQYEKDAVSIEEISNTISSMASNISEIMAEVSNAIQSIAESSQSTADISSNIMDAVADVSTEVNNVSDMSHSQQSIATDLNTVVNQFKL